MWALRKARRVWRPLAAHDQGLGGHAPAAPSSDDMLELAVDKLRSSAGIFFADDVSCGQQPLNSTQLHSGGPPASSRVLGAAR